MDRQSQSVELKPWTTEPLRAKLGAQFTRALQDDPVCNGRVASGTIEWLVNEAICAAEATARHALRTRASHQQERDRD
jgi:hypothetical protein